MSELLLNLPLLLSIPLFAIWRSWEGKNLKHWPFTSKSVPYFKGSNVVCYFMMLLPLWAALYPELVNRWEDWRHALAAGFAVGVAFVAHMQLSHGVGFPDGGTSMPKKYTKGLSGVFTKLTNKLCGHGRVEDPVKWSTVWQTLRYGTTGTVLMAVMAVATGQWLLCAIGVLPMWLVGVCYKFGCDIARSKGGKDFLLYCEWVMAPVVAIGLTIGAW